jgi:hypothetical protein
MAYYVDRNLLSGENEVKKLYNLASQAGVEVIELVLTNGDCKSNHKIINFEIPAPSQKTNKNPYDTKVQLNTDLQVIGGGTVWFYLSGNGSCWGYVLDTPRNRVKLAHSFGADWFKIVDKKVRDEIVELAKSMDLPTTPNPPPQIGVRYSSKEKEAMKALEKAKERAEEAAKKIAEMEEKLKFYESKRDKPLGAVKIDKDKREELK